MGLHAIGLHLQAPIKSLAKIINFRRSENKLRDTFTTDLVTEKFKPTIGFFERKVAQYETLHAGIDALRAEASFKKIECALKNAITGMVSKGNLHYAK